MERHKLSRVSGVGGAGAKMSIGHKINAAISETNKIFGKSERRKKKYVCLCDVGVMLELLSHFCAVSKTLNGRRRSSRRQR